jgi:hypothetical protein
LRGGVERLGHGGKIGARKPGVTPAVSTLLTGTGKLAPH